MGKKVRITGVLHLSINVPVYSFVNRRKDDRFAASIHRYLSQAGALRKKDRRRRMAMFETNVISVCKGKVSISADVQAKSTDHRVVLHALRLLL